MLFRKRLSFLHLVKYVACLLGAVALVSCTQKTKLLGAFGSSSSSSTGTPLLSCSFNGQLLANGGSTTGFSASSVPFGQLCSSVQETVTCNNGVLSPNNAFSSCTVASATSCTFNGSPLASGSSTIGYSTASVPFGQSCSSVQETVTCNNGVLNPSNAFGTCTVATNPSPTPAPQPCSFNGQTVASGSSVTAWQAATVPFGQTCTSQSRTCSNGNLSGTYTFSNCTVSAPASCTFNGVTVASGSKVTPDPYTTASVPFGQTCQTEVVTCNNGVLSPSGAFASCTVNAATPTPLPTPTGPAPAINFIATPNSVVAATLPGTTLSWSTANVTSCIASGDWDNTAFQSGTVPLSGSLTRALLSAGTTSYTLTCTGSGGSATQTVKVAASAMPAQSPLSTNASCLQPGPPYPQTGQPGISFPGGTTVQTGTPAALGCPTSTVFNGLVEILDQSPHIPRHAVTAAIGTMPSALAAANLPYIPNVYVLTRRDAALLFFPNVAGAADYRAYAVNNNVSFITTASNGVQPRGAFIGCAGFRQHSYESGVVNGHHTRELLQTLEIPGFVNNGNYTIILEAISSPCPFVGIPSGADSSYTDDNLNGGANETYDSGGAIAIFRTPATMMNLYGNEIINGQGSAISWSNRLTQRVGNAVAPNDPTLPSDPVVIARTAIAMQLPFFDETVNAPTFDVETPAAAAAGATAIMDNFANEVSFSPSSVQLNPDYPSVAGGSSAFSYFLLGQSGSMTPTAANAANANYAVWSMNTNPGTSAFQHLGRLYTTFGDAGGEVSAAIGFTSLKTAPEPLDSQLYIHSMFRINSESSMRRYWWWTLCGGATQAELMDPTTHLPLIRPTFYETSFAGGGDNPSFPNNQPIGNAPKQNAKAKECLSLAIAGVAEPAGANPRTSASIKAQIHPAGYQSGIITLGNTKTDIGQQVGDTSGELGFRYRLDASGNKVGSIVDPFDQVSPLVHYDIFVRSDRLVVFVNGRQGFCVDMSGRPLAMKYGMITYGDLIYHSNLEYELTAPQFIGGHYVSSDSQTGSTDGSSNEGSQLYNDMMNLPVAASRAWDVISHSGLVPIPPQFSTFDPGLCVKPASTAIH